MDNRIKPGDLVVLSERSRHYPGHELGYTGYTNLDQPKGGPPSVYGVVLSQGEVVLYLGRYDGYTKVLKGDQKVFIYVALSELVKVV